MGQGSVRVISGNVGVIRAGEAQGSAIKREAAVVTVINSALGIVIVGGSGADPLILTEGITAIPAHGVIEHGIIVGLAIGISALVVATAFG